MDVLRIGTRGSQLALFQARTVAELLRERAGRDSEIVVIRTSGDRLAEAPLSDIGGKRLFVKEIEEALLARDIDLAVHSSKDMPAVLPDGLAIGAVLPREDARDAVVLPGPDPTRHLTLETLTGDVGLSPRIGTSSVRRVAQLARVWPGAQFQPIRGNLDTRLRKVDEGGFDALVLAAAGLNRLARADRISFLLPVDLCIPAPGQGIIAVEVRSDAAGTLETAQRIDDRDAATALAAERELVARLGGGCQMPLGAYAAVAGDTMSLVAVVTSLDGSRIARADAAGPAADPASLAAAVAAALTAQGAGEILADVRRAQAPVEDLQP